jgi:hypothetical protein
LKNLVKKVLLLHYEGDDVYNVYNSFSDERKGTGAVQSYNWCHEEGDNIIVYFVIIRRLGTKLL